MSDLERTQRILADLLRAPSSLVQDAALASAADALAAGNARLSPVEQVDIYREQYFLRHLDVLREDFRSLEVLLGDASFDTLARDYLAVHPPSSFSLRDLGHAMASFVRDHAPWSHDPFLFDLATVEWAFVEAFDAADVPPLDLATIASAPESSWPGAKVILHPALQRLSLRYPAHDVRATARLAADASDEPLAAVVRPDARAVNVAVYRGREVLQYIEVEPLAFALLDQLAKGQTLGAACETVAAASGEPLASFDTKLGGWFQDWTAFGWIARVVFPD